MSDLISREALKEALDEQMNFDENCRDSVFDIINNAPTIHTEDCEGCPYCPNSNGGIPIGVE